MDSCFPPLAILSLNDTNRLQNSVPEEQREDGRSTSASPDSLSGNIEILHDLDLYYVRQIAHNSKEYDLEQKIEVEIKMREGSARLLAAARHRGQSLEAARALLTSNERMSAYMAELQRRKTNPDPPKKSSSPAGTGKVSLSELRIPLMWRDSDHFKNRGDHRRFAVFCLARLGTEIHDTSLICPVDRSHTDISFADVLLFNNVPAEFELLLEVYSCILQEDLSIASTPRKIKKTIHSSISKTVGKKLAASLRDELDPGKNGPRFDLIASARLNLDDADDAVRTHDLVIDRFGNKSRALPLFGHFCCRVAAQPDSWTKEMCSGTVLFDGRTHWARLQAYSLKIWESKKLAEENQIPLHTISIDKGTCVQSSNLSNRELRITSLQNDQEKVSVIGFESNDETQKWLRALLAQIKDNKKWKRAAERLQEIPCLERIRNSFVGSRRQGSLYDETPLIESVSTEYSLDDPVGREIPTLPKFGTTAGGLNDVRTSIRCRSASIGNASSRKLTTTTLAFKSHWPFSNKN